MRYDRLGGWEITSHQRTAVGQAAGTAAGVRRCRRGARSHPGAGTSGDRPTWPSTVPVGRQAPLAAAFSLEPALTLTALVAGT